MTSSYALESMYADDNADEGERGDERMYADGADFDSEYTDADDTTEPSVPELANAIAAANADAAEYADADTSWWPTPEEIAVTAKLVAAEREVDRAEYADYCDDMENLPAWPTDAEIAEYEAYMASVRVRAAVRAA